jgi:pSer/pThr/pTyr-binding forkhead associated (FHA) protein
MTDPVLARFAQACGAQQPLELHVELVDGDKLAEGQLQAPFALVGRDDACDVTLTDPEVDPRHVWLQILDGRIYAVDLGSRTGLLWPDGHRGSGWLEVNRPLRIGPFVLRQRCLVAAPPDYPPLPPDYQPLQSDATLQLRFPNVVLEFRNGKRARDRWRVNRRLTLIGRAPECKIRLSADDITSYHCSLVFTPAGLWVVDLSGRGVVVNGERMRVAPLDNGADLWVGRFRIAVHTTVTQSQHGPLASISQQTAHPVATSAITIPSAAASSEFQPSSVAPPSASLPDDEVPLGTLSAHRSESAAGLSSSHIMAETFTPTGSDISQSILIAQSGSLTPPPQARPQDFDLSQVRSYVDPAPANVATTPPTHIQHGDIMLVREIIELHYRMVDCLQQSCELLVQLTAVIHPEQEAAWQGSLTILRQIGDQIRKLRTQLSHFSSDTPREIRYPPPRQPSTALPNNNLTDTPPSEPTQADIPLHTKAHVRLEHHSKTWPHNPL